MSGFPLFYLYQGKARSEDLLIQRLKLSDIKNAWPRKKHFFVPNCTMACKKKTRPSVAHVIIVSPPVPIGLGFWFGTALGLGLGLWGLNFGLGTRAWQYLNYWCLDSLEVALEDPNEVQLKVPHEVFLIFSSELPDPHMTLTWNPFNPGSIVVLWF